MCLCWVDDQTGTRDRALGTSGTLRTSGILGTSGIRGSRLGTPRASGTFEGTLRMSAIACRDSSEKSIWSNPLLRFMRCASSTSGRGFCVSCFSRLFRLSRSLRSLRLFCSPSSTPGLLHLLCMPQLFRSFPTPCFLIT